MMQEGLGGPVSMDPNFHNNQIEGLDPCLEDCCRRELEDNRKYNAMTRTLNRFDVTQLAARKRRHWVSRGGRNNDSNTHQPDDAEDDDLACRCCFDPDQDGGEYQALIEFKRDRLLSQAERDEIELENINGNIIGVGSDYAATTGKHQDHPDKSEQQNRQEEGDPESSDDEFDYLLDEDPAGNGNLTAYDEQRKAEWDYQLLEKQVAMTHGYGRHGQVHPGRILGFAGLTAVRNRMAPPKAVVLHLYDPSSIVSASLDDVLERQIAPQYPGTICARSNGRSVLLGLGAPDQQQHQKQSLSALSSLRVDVDLPCLVAIRDGVIRTTCPRLHGMYSTSSDAIEKAAVLSFLDQAGVLLDRPPPMMELCLIQPEQEALMDAMDMTAAKTAPSKNADEEQRYDCGVKGCCKPYAHEHVGVTATPSSSELVVPPEEETAGDAPPTETED